MTGEKIAGYKMAYSFDIDTEEDFLLAEHHITIREKMKKGNKLKIVCDIDGIIAHKTVGNKYDEATPITANISILQKLYQQGHRIILHTARGYASGINWEETTKVQMKKWGVPYDNIVFGKPDADFYIDDKFSTLQFLSNII